MSPTATISQFLELLPENIDDHAFRNMVGALDTLIHINKTHPKCYMNVTIKGVTFCYRGDKQPIIVSIDDKKETSILPFNLVEAILYELLKSKSPNIWNIVTFEELDTFHY